METHLICAIGQANLRLWASWWLVAVFLLPMIISGCKNPDEFPPLPPVASVGEMAIKSEEDRAREEDWLRRLQLQEYPAYTVQPGDTFTIRVFDNPELEASPIVVPPDGRISLLLIGVYDMLGKTVDQAVKELEEKYGEYIRNPKVAILPLAIVSQTATLAGKVLQSGSYPVNQRVRLADLFAMGVGTPIDRFNNQSVELADFSASFIIRKDERLPVDIQRALHGDPMHNICIHPGDYLYIASRANRLIGVMGEVNHASFIVWYENMGLLEAIVNAGGLKEEYWQNIIVIRGGMVDPVLYRINIDDVLQGKTANPALQVNDIVYVPKDGFAEYNVYVRKLFPTGQLLNMVLSPITFWSTR